MLKIKARHGTGWLPDIKEHNTRINQKTMGEIEERRDRTE
jgi:hypothetical protein